MKKLFLIIAMTVFAGTAYAAEVPGSYTDTCRNINVSGETLSAECKTMSGAWNKTSLPFATSCVGIVSNINGTLACSAPTGSFARTCRDASVTEHILSATCERINRTWVRSHTNFSGFQHPVSNCDGQLVDNPKC